MLLLPAKTKTAQDAEFNEIVRIVDAYVRKVRMREDDPILAMMDIKFIDYITILR